MTEAAPMCQDVMRAALADQHARTQAAAAQATPPADGREPEVMPWPEALSAREPAGAGNRT